MLSPPNPPPPPPNSNGSSVLQPAPPSPPAPSIPNSCSWAAIPPFPACTGSKSHPTSSKNRRLGSHSLLLAAGAHVQLSAEAGEKDRVEGVLSEGSFGHWGVEGSEILQCWRARVAEVVGRERGRGVESWGDGGGGIVGGGSAARAGPSSVGDDSFGYISEPFRVGGSFPLPRVLDRRRSGRSTMLGFLAEEGGEELDASSGDGTVGSEDLELGDGELDFSTLVGDVVERVRKGALEDVEDEGRAGDDGVVGDL